MRYSAAQVKHSASITQTQSAMLEGLLSQIKQAFRVPFRLPDSPRERYISSVYVMNSGGITDGAKDYLLATLQRESFGDNVHFFDGARLESINQFAVFASDRELRPRLIGLRTQLLLNVAIWQSVLKGLPEFGEARGSMLSAIENYLTAPIAMDVVAHNELHLLWQEARIIDAICQRHIAITLSAKDAKQRDGETLRGVMAKAIPRAARVIESVERALSALQPLSNL